MQLGEALWNSDPESLIKLFESIPPRPLLADRTIAALKVGDLIEGLRQSPTLAPSLIARRPDLLTKPSFWTLPGVSHSDAFKMAMGNPEQLDAVLGAMLVANRGDLAAEVARGAGAFRQLQAVAKYWTADTTETCSGAVQAWLGAALGDERAVAEALSLGIIRNRAILLVIARKTGPDFVPNDYGEDPWLTAARDAVGDMSDDNSRYLSAYLLARAFGMRSRNQAELIAYALDAVYFAAAQSTLSEDAWMLLERLVPRAFLWVDWDRCPRICAAVADTFVNRNLSPLLFAKAAQDDGLFTVLAEEVSRKGREGRRFLKGVRQAIPDAGLRLTVRMKTLEDLE